MNQKPCLLTRRKFGMAPVHRDPPDEEGSTLKGWGEAIIFWTDGLSGRYQSFRRSVLSILSRVTAAIDHPQSAELPADLDRSRRDALFHASTCR